jgi:hypothetical protein
VPEASISDAQQAVFDRAQARANELGIRLKIIEY